MSVWSVYRVLCTIVCDVFVRVCGKGAILRQFVMFLFCFVFLFVSERRTVCIDRTDKADCRLRTVAECKQAATLTHTTNGITHFSVIVIVVAAVVALP